MLFGYLIGGIAALMLIGAALPWVFAILEAIFRSTVGLAILGMVALLALVTFLTISS